MNKRDKPIIRFVRGYWRVSLDVGAIYDVRATNRNAMNACYWCGIYNEYGYAPRNGLDDELVKRARSKVQQIYQD